ncbi:hypothetical protein IEQ34_011046 [Dendrobium chrysotoxum]|uniref:Pentatricopeptide repeat-containing protein n=1 Tax=Dendrobium chrysotoxum TaxID=161865 RepID=A0AAV7GXJ6_DENCH|nr:hypothetical protein IEQ34_011046 [Dendrobium chrysotoxum]
MDLHANAIEVFKTMCSSEIFPNSFTFSSALKAGGNLVSIKQGRCIHACGIKYGVMDEFTNSSLLDKYAQCGVLEDSRKLFDEIGSEEIVSLNTMITAYAQHGQGREALDIYIYYDARAKFGAKPCYFRVSFVCLQSLRTRAGFLDRGKLFIDSMPFEADASIWTIFLAACKLHGNFELAQLARKKLDGILCEDNSTLVLVSKMFSKEGKWDDAEKERNKISSDGMRKEPGLSWVQIAEAFA